MPGMGEDIEGMIQHAPHSFLHSMFLLKKKPRKTGAIFDM